MLLTHHGLTNTRCCR